jgi:Bacterial transcriptional activator domain
LLWRGAPLGDLVGEPFAWREIARLDDLRVAALEQLVEAKLALGRHHLGAMQQCGEFPLPDAQQAGS